jgi:hypothetical protein
MCSPYSRLGDKTMPLSEQINLSRGPFIEILYIAHHIASSGWVTKYICIQSTTVYFLSSELGNWDSPLQPLSRQRVCLSPRYLRGGGAHSPAGEGLGESQFRRLENKLSTLPTLCGWVYVRSTGLLRDFLCSAPCYTGKCIQSE